MYVNEAITCALSLYRPRPLSHLASLAMTLPAQSLCLNTQRGLNDFVDAANVCSPCSFTSYAARLLRTVVSPHRYGNVLLHPVVSGPLLQIRQYALSLVGAARSIDLQKQTLQRRMQKHITFWCFFQQYFYVCFILQLKACVFNAALLSL